MTARIFISYRTADGVDKATALARELGEIFGNAAVFLDKEDLRGGSAWRKEIHRTLDGKPILLLLLTPQLISAEDNGGRLRITDPDDPVRRELQGALEAGAHIIPLLCDGVEEVPDTRSLPPPFDRIGELTWRRLRAYDWASDIARLVNDLEALGIARLSGDAPNQRRRADDLPPSMEHYARTKRRVIGLLIAGVASMVVVAAGWWWLREEAPGKLAGPWQAQLWQGELVTLVLAENGDTVTLTSAPISIAERPDWSDYRRFWRERGSGELTAIHYRGQGRRIEAPGVAPALDIALQVLASPAGDGTVIDSGNLSLRLSADGRTLAGRIWLNSAQADQAAMLTRLRR